MGRVLVLGAMLLVVACRARVPQPPIEATHGGGDVTSGAGTVVEDEATGPGGASVPPGAAGAEAATADGGAVWESGAGAAQAGGDALGESADPFAAAIAVDLHADVVMQVAERGRDFMADDGEWTIERARRGGLDAQIFPLWISPREADQEAALKRAERAFLSMIEGSGGALAAVRTAAEIRERAAAGQLGALLGIEGALPLGEDPANLDPLVAMGLRYLGLTWNASNAFAEAASELREPHGLTEAGRRLVERANDAGVLIDLAHASAGTFWDAHRWSRSPLLVSHTGLRALRDIPRNIDDLQLLAVARSGGVVGIVWHSGFLMALGEGETVAPLSALLDAYDHAKGLGAVAALALGSDLDGGIHPPAELATIDLLPALPLGLRERGWTDEEIAGVLGENFLRLLDAADSAAAHATDSPAREWAAAVTCGGLGTEKEAAAISDRIILPGVEVGGGTEIGVSWEEEEGTGAVVEVWGEVGGRIEVRAAGGAALTETTIGDSGGARVELPADVAAGRRVVVVPVGATPVRIDEVAVWVR